MKMKLVYLLVGCAITLTGCESANQWAMPDPSLQKFNDDWDLCRKENSSEKNDGSVDENKAKDCMRAKGYNDTNRK
jgi:hypothetical protein